MAADVAERGVAHHLAKLLVDPRGTSLLPRELSQRRQRLEAFAERANCLLDFTAPEEQLAVFERGAGWTRGGWAVAWW